MTAELLVHDLREPAPIGLVHPGMGPDHILETSARGVLIHHPPFPRQPIDRDQSPWPCDLGEEHRASALEDAELEDVLRLQVADQLHVALHQPPRLGDEEIGLLHLEALSAPKAVLGEDLERRFADDEEILRLP